MNNNNLIEMIGMIDSELQFDHEVFGEKFYSFMIKVSRLSDTFDVLPVIISERLYDIDSLSQGMKISINAQLRSYNAVEDNKSKLILKVFVKQLEVVDDNIKDKNNINLEGFICKQPIHRQTPKGREICDLFLAVNREYKKSDYIPTICWGRNANFAKDLEVGNKIQIIGRLQSRKYVKKIDEENSVEKMTYEVSITNLDASSNKENEIAITVE